MAEETYPAPASPAGSPAEGGSPAPAAPRRTAAGGFSRRTFALGALGAAGLAALGAGARVLPTRSLLRPPGGQDETALVGTCLHCEKCREVCPAAAIGVTHLEEGLLNTGTPSLDFHSGWCDFCTGEPGGPRCVAVCPTGALALPANAVLGNTDTGEVGTVILGRAVVNRDWCLAQRGMKCRSCVNACAFGAVELGYDNVPVVDEERCNGCGACENVCESMTAGSIAPGATDRAIVVVPLDEWEA